MTAPAPRIAVIDYGMGNRRSVEKALRHVGADVVVSSDHDELSAADGLVLPGVGAFPRGIERLGADGLDDLVRERAAAGVPLLGICLGMQLLFDRSSELGSCAGLGLIPGTVRALDAPGLRVPHIGWNDVTFTRASPLTAGLPAGGAAFYHVHSYVAEPAEAAAVLGLADYGERFTTMVACGSVYGVQFHPEKSSRDGLQLLRAFTELAGGQA